jgi:hypothetical protein
MGGIGPCTVGGTVPSQRTGSGTKHVESGRKIREKRARAGLPCPQDRLGECEILCGQIDLRSAEMHTQVARRARAEAGSMGVGENRSASIALPLTIAPDLSVIGYHTEAAL